MPFVASLLGGTETSQVSLLAKRAHWAAWQVLGTVQDCFPWDESAGVVPTSSGWLSEHNPEQQLSVHWV